MKITKYPVLNSDSNESILVGIDDLAKILIALPQAVSATIYF